MVRVTLLTDFGTGDGFVGAVKGVLATEAPDALVQDVSHSISPGDIPKASRVLGRFWREYPPGTVHLVVVDPGVGTSRRALAVKADGRFLVGPDNGVFTQVFSIADEWWAVDLSGSDLLHAPHSNTFHGRDWFAPAAALLAKGTPIEALGSPVSDPVVLVPSEPISSGPWLLGEVVEIDRFGNLATNIPGERIGESGEVEVNGVSVPLRRAYGDVEEGELVAVVNSDGLVEVGARNGSAARKIEAEVGTPVRMLTR